MSFMDIAEYLTMRPNLFAVTKHNLSDRQEVVVDFTNESHFNLFRNQSSANAWFSNLRAVAELDFP